MGGRGGQPYPNPNPNPIPDPNSTLIRTPAGQRSTVHSEEVWDDVEASRFAVIWNEVIKSMREEDVIDDISRTVLTYLQLT